jgi:hypothetical protein
MKAAPNQRGPWKKIPTSDLRKHSRLWLLFRGIEPYELMRELAFHSLTLDGMRFKSSNISGLARIEKMG